MSDLATGFFFDKPREGAPEFVRGRLSIQVEVATKMLQEKVNDKGYVNLDLLRSKDGKKLYLTVNDWKPEPKADDPAEIERKKALQEEIDKRTPTGTPASEITDDGIPF